MVTHSQAEFDLSDFKTSLIYFLHCSPCFWQLKRTETECTRSQMARMLHLADEVVFALQLYQIESRLGRSPIWQTTQYVCACIVWIFLHPLVTVGNNVWLGMPPTAVWGRESRSLMQSDWTLLCFVKLNIYNGKHNGCNAKLKLHARKTQSI